MEYADDVDFIVEEKQLYNILPAVGAELQDVNKSKTEFTHVFLADTQETEFTHVFLADTQEDDKDEAELRGKEKWRKSKILGSLLCSSSDITARCIRGNIVFHFLLEAVDPRIKDPPNN